MMITKFTDKLYVDKKSIFIPLKYYGNEWISNVIISYDKNHIDMIFEYKDKEISFMNSNNVYRHYCLYNMNIVDKDSINLTDDSDTELETDDRISISNMGFDSDIIEVINYILSIDLDRYINNISINDVDKINENFYKYVINAVERDDNANMMLSSLSELTDLYLDKTGYDINSDIHINYIRLKGTDDKFIRMSFNAIIYGKYEITARIDLHHTDIDYIDIKDISNDLTLYHHVKKFMPYVKKDFELEDIFDIYKQMSIIIIDFVNRYIGIL